MGTKAGLTVEDYLHTSFPDLDQEYRDGELEAPSFGLGPVDLFE